MSESKLNYERERARKEMREILRRERQAMIAEYGTPDDVRGQRHLTEGLLALCASQIFGKIGVNRPGEAVVLAEEMLRMAKDTAKELHPGPDTEGGVS